MKSIKELQSLDNTWAVITGGAGHVAFAAAQTLLELGASVILIDREEQGLAKASSLLKSPAKVKTVICDLADEAQIENAVEQVAEITGGKINVLINNAAFVGTSNLTGWGVPFEQQSFDTFKQCLDVNLSAPFLLTKLCLPLLKSHDHPVKSVINISSIYAMVGPQMELYAGTNMGNPAAYAASKAGLMQFTQWLACVEAPSIRANNIVLGGIFRNQDESFLKKYTAKTPLGRMANEEDIKGAIAYLSSSLSNYYTGQSIVLDGGWTAH